jgi:hypothetical protein
MKVGIMQPYFLPYIGYFQLMAAVDKFVLLDDVNFINRGWVNRNRIAVNGQPSWLTVPLSGASQNRLIREIDIAPDDGWVRKMHRAVAVAYAKAPEADSVIPIFESWLSKAAGNLADFLLLTLSETAARLGIETEILPTSSIFPKNGHKGQERILNICRELGASSYINPPGGRELYDRGLFSDARMELSFLRPNLGALRLAGPPGDASLSILHILMHKSREEAAQAAGTFDLDPA